MFSRRRQFILASPAPQPLDHFLVGGAFTGFDFAESGLNLLPLPIVVAVRWLLGFVMPGAAQCKRAGRRQGPFHGFADGEICLPQQVLWNFYRDCMSPTGNLGGHTSAFDSMVTRMHIVVLRAH